MPRSLSELKEKVFVLKAQTQRIFLEPVSVDMVRTQIEAALQERKAEFIAGVLSGLDAEDLVTVSSHLNTWWEAHNKPQIVPQAVGQVSAPIPQPESTQAEIGAPAQTVIRGRGRPRKVSV